MADRHGHVVVIGDDRVGVRVLEELVALGVAVRAVAFGADSPFARAAGSSRVPLVTGDPEHAETLREAGIADASACALLANSDLANLHVALALEELAPDARVVLRLFNASLAAAVRRLVGSVTVLSAEEIAAPTFVEAALRGTADFRLRVGDRRMAVQEVDRDDPYCWLALADARAERAEPRLFPTDGRQVVGLVDTGGVVAAETAPEPRGALDLRIAQRSSGWVEIVTGAARAWWLVLRTVAGIVDRRLVVVGLLFALVAATGALVFDGLLAIDLLDSLYFVVTTVTTTGYGDISTLDASAQAQLVNIGLMLLGGLMLALVFALVTDAVVGARITRALGQYPVPKRHHVIVCGMGRTGGLVVQALVDAGVPCVIVDRDEAGMDLALIRRHRIPVVLGDLASEETLDVLRLESARALMVMTGDEVANLQCALLARERVPTLRVVLRLFDHDLAARVERAADIQLSRGVSALAAPAFVAAILGRRTTAVLPIGGEVLQVVTLTAERSTDVGALEHGCQARVLAVPGKEFPEPDTPVAPGDELMVVGNSGGVAELERRALLSSLTLGRLGGQAK
jgi:Trk K+ transport system NAD-binding subunit